MFCKKCGSELAIDSEYCSKCGTKVENNLSEEEYDPLLALDRVETVEDNVIWEEAPLGDESIIINAKEGRPVKPVVEEPEQPVEKQETVIKESMAQGLRAAKSTIAHPIKPRKRIKPQTTSPKQPVTPIEEEVIPEIVEPQEETIIEPASEVIESVNEVQTEEVVFEEAPIEEAVDETIEADTIDVYMDDSEEVDIFDDFVVDDSFGIIDESPEIIEEVPEIVEETPEPVAETIEPVAGTPESEPVVETPSETITETTEPTIDEYMEETVVDDEAVFEPMEEQKLSPEQALFEEKPPIEDSFEEEVIIEEIEEKPIIKAPVTEKVAEQEPVKEVVEKPITAPTKAQNISKDISPAPGAKVAGAAERAETTISDEVITSETESELLKSLESTKIDEKNISPVKDDVDSVIKSKFNSTLDEEEVFDVDENVNSLTSKITTVLIIVLILIIAVVVATFLVQNLGL